MLKTTLNNLDNSMFEFPGFWHPEREKLLAALKKTRADDEPVPYSFIVETCGLPAAVYCCRAATKYYHVWREFACWCALSVKHLWDMPPIVEEYLTTRNEEIAEKAWELTRAINPRPYSGNLACLAALYAANFPEYLEKHLAAALVADYALRFALLAGADINPLTKKFLELVG